MLLAGILHQNLSSCAAAISDFIQVVTLEPEFIEGCLSRRQAYQITGQMQKAAKDSEYIAILRSRQS